MLAVLWQMATIQPTPYRQVPRTHVSGPLCSPKPIWDITFPAPSWGSLACLGIDKVTYCLCATEGGPCAWDLKGTHHERCIVSDTGSASVNNMHA